MRIVVVGASGNVGTAILRQLRAHGDDEVVGIARRIPPDDEPYGVADWHSVDVSDDSAAATLTELFRGADSVVNLAWGFQPGRDVAYLERVGVGGLDNVLLAARAAGVPHLVHMSSVGAYSAAPRGTVVTEDWATDGVPSSPYSVQKAAAERSLDRHEATGELPAVCRLRPGLIMQRDAGSSLLRYGLPAWFPAAGLDLLPLLPIDRTFAVPVVNSGDVAAAVIRAIHRQATGPFNLATATPHSRHPGSSSESQDYPCAVENIAVRCRRRLVRAGGAARPGLDRPRVQRAVDRQRPGPERTWLGAGGRHRNHGAASCSRHAERPVHAQRTDAASVRCRGDPLDSRQRPHYPPSVALTERPQISADRCIDPIAAETEDQEAAKPGCRGSFSTSAIVTQRTSADSKFSRSVRGRSKRASAVV